MKLVRKTYIVKQTLNQTQLKRAEEIFGIPSPIKSIEVDEIGRWHVSFKKKMITGMQHNIVSWRQDPVEQIKKEYILTGVKRHLVWNGYSYVEGEENDQNWFKLYCDSMSQLKNEGDVVEYPDYFPKTPVVYLEAGASAPTPSDGEGVVETATTEEVK